jgi:hypothetical protein
MTERRQLSHRYGSAAPRRRRPAAARHPETVPAPPPVLAPDEPTILGFPAEPDDGTDPAGGSPVAAEVEPAPAYGDFVEAGADPATLGQPAEPSATGVGLYVLRSSDAPAGSLLMIAGAAGGMSLFLPWAQHGGELGLALVRRGLESAGVVALLHSGLALPVAVAVAGGVLFVLGLLAFWPARSHRLVGVLALFVALAVASGIVVRVADVGWDPLRTDPGILCAVVLSGAGVLGALKAMLTPPEVTTDPP